MTETIIRLRKLAEELNEIKHSESYSILANSSTTIEKYLTWVSETKAFLDKFNIGKDYSPYNGYDGYLTDGNGLVLLDQFVRQYPNFKIFISDIENGLITLKTSNKIDKNKDELIKSIFDGFHKMAIHLEKRQRDRPNLILKDEYDLQYLVHAILRLFYDDIRDEDYVSNFAGSSSRVDFYIKDINTLVEIKKTREGLGDKEIGEQLIVDINRYKNFPNCDNIVFFVYDPEYRLKNPSGIEIDINSRSDDKHNIKLYIRPKRK